MSIEKEVKQIKFQNEWHKLRVNLLFTANWLVEEVNTFLKPYGISQSQFNVLRIVRGSDPKKPLSVYEIRERLVNRMSDTSRMVARLEKMDLLERRPCKNDRRHKRVFMTEKGQALLAQIDEKMPSMDRITTGITPEEAEQISQLLEKMRNVKK